MPFALYVLKAARELEEGCALHDVFKAGGGDKHNLIPMCTRTKGLQSIEFVFCFFVLPHSWLFKTILESYDSYP